MKGASFATGMFLLGMMSACEPAVPVRPTVAGSAARLDVAALAPIDAAVQRELDAGKMPGCVVMIGRHDGVAFARAYGQRALRPVAEPMTLDTVFDLASLTKPVATATAVMLLVERGLVRLDDPVAVSLPEFGQNGKDTMTVRQLLTHVGGLIPDNALSDYDHGLDEAIRRVHALELQARPGAEFRYTDVGFIVLAELVRKVSGREFDAFVQEELFRPLAMDETGFLPGDALRARAAVTEQRDGRWMRGEVHDPRAYRMGGVAGHAGLFSTAADLARYARMMLQGGSLDGVRVLSRRTVQEMTRAHQVPGGVRALGWDVRSRFSKNRGELFSDAAFGHGGFTGTVLWMDPGLDLFVVFLSNRVHPEGKGEVNRLAGRIGSIAAAALRPVDRADVGTITNRDPSGPRAELVTTDAPVRCGIDVLVENGFAELNGRTVGLITNHTGRDRAGRSTASLLLEAPNVNLVALFSPEHGLAGQADEKVGDSVDPVTALPVYSLYDENRRPDPEHLEGLDALVFDVQDVGTRFYTYISTLGMAMEVCASSGVGVVVLDRPNPVNGVQVGGPMRDAGESTFVAYHDIPLRHGMTVGELAAMFRAERELHGLALDVVPVVGWRREQFFDQTGLTWVNPSPNMRSVNQALLYPGIGLLEFTNLSVGRGTDTPFERVGAPWLEGSGLAWALNHQGLPGVSFTPVEYTPNASKFQGEACEGIQILITDRDRVDPIWTGLALACELRDRHPDDWDPSRIPKLLVNAALYDAFLDGATARDLLQQIEPDVQAFLRRRQPFLLY